MNSFSSAALLCLVLFVTNISASFAQDVPASADPSRFIDTFERDEKPDEENILRHQADEGIETQAPEGAESYTFILREFHIEGVTALENEQIAPLYQYMIGQTVSVADIFKVAAEITRNYRQQGYILARASVPPQEIDSGTVVIEVIEGNIQEVILEGLEDSPSFLIDNMKEKIEKASAFNVRLLERQLLLLNRVTGLQAVGILEPLSDPASAPPGAVALKLVFAPRASIYTLSVDNHGSNYVGPWQGGASVRIPHTTLVHGITEFSIYTSPETQELGFVSLSETVPLTVDGLTLNAAIKYSRSEPGGSLENLELESEYLSLSLGLEYPLYLSRSRQLDIFGRFEYNNSDSDILGTRFYDDQLRVLRGGIKGHHGDIFDGQIYGDVTFSQGLDILGARETGSIDLSRAKGHSDFNKLEASLSYLKSLGGSFALKTTLMGQYAFQPLLSSEEFGYGGYNIGRAYNNSEITGDSGINFLAELSYYDWAKYNSDVWDPGFTPFIFYDAGKVWNRDNGVDAESGASAGLGVELSWGRPASLRFTISQPLSREVENPSFGNGKNPKFLVSFIREF